MFWWVRCLKNPSEWQIVGEVLMKDVMIIMNPNPSKLQNNKEIEFTFIQCTDLLLFSLTDLLIYPAQPYQFHSMMIKKDQENDLSNSDIKKFISNVNWGDRRPGANHEVAICLRFGKLWESICKRCLSQVIIKLALYVIPSLTPFLVTDNVLIHFNPFSLSLHSTSHLFLLSFDCDGLIFHDHDSITYLCSH